MEGIYASHILVWPVSGVATGSRPVDSGVYRVIAGSHDAVASRNLAVVR